MAGGGTCRRLLLLSSAGWCAKDASSYPVAGGGLDHYCRDVSLLPSENSLWLSWGSCLRVWASNARRVHQIKHHDRVWIVPCLCCRLLLLLLTACGAAVWVVWPAHCNSISCKSLADLYFRLHVHPRRRSCRWQVPIVDRTLATCRRHLGCGSLSGGCLACNVSSTLRRTCFAFAL